MSDIRTTVFKVLNDTQAIGYDYSNEHPKTIARNILRYNGTLNCTVETIMPHIVEWQEQQ